MTNTEQNLIDACIKRHMSQLEWEKIDREGERFPRHLRSIESEIAIHLIDIEVYTSELVSEREQ